MGEKAKFENAVVWVASVTFLLAVSLSAQAAQYDAEYYEPDQDAFFLRQGQAPERRLFRVRSRF